MTPFDPTQPQPGDWAAALATIEAAEARHDAVRRWGRMGAAFVAVSAIAGSLWWFAPTAGEVKQGGALQADVETSIATTMQEVVSEVTNAEADSELHIEAIESGANSAIGSPALASNEVSVASYETVLPPTTPVLLPHPSTLILQETPPDRPAARSEQARGAATRIDLEGLSMGFSPEKSLIRLHPIEAVLAEGAAARPAYQVVKSDAMSPQPEQPWGVLLGGEAGAWTLMAARELRPDWFLRAGGVWDARNRKWVADAGRDVFGASQAQRSVLSNQAVWASLGMERRYHLKGRWGAVARFDGQYLLARHLVEGQWGQGEQIVAGTAEAWGHLKEESSWRLSWGVGVDWAAAESHDLRLTVGGHWSPTATFDYIQWTEGQPVGLGEFRLTWIWK